MRVPRHYEAIRMRSGIAELVTGVLVTSDLCLSAVGELNLTDSSWSLASSRDREVGWMHSLDFSPLSFSRAKTATLQTEVFVTGKKKSFPIA